jgi:hypothetical protein
LVRLTISAKARPIQRGIERDKVPLRELVPPLGCLLEDAVDELDVGPTALLGDVDRIVPTGGGAGPTTGRRKGIWTCALWLDPFR